MQDNNWWQGDSVVGQGGAPVQRAPQAVPGLTPIGPRKADMRTPDQIAFDQARLSDLQAKQAKDAQDQKDAAEKLQRQRQLALGGAQDALSAIASAKKQIGWNTTGLVGRALESWPGSDSADLRANINTIKSHVGFDRLQAMRDASPTGGALGAVSDTENRLLSDSIASLSTDQSAEQLKANLEAIERHYRAVIDTINGKMPDGYSQDGKQGGAAGLAGGASGGGQSGGPNGGPGGGQQQNLLQATLKGIGDAPGAFTDWLSGANVVSRDFGNDGDTVTVTYGDGKTETRPVPASVTNDPDFRDWYAKQYPDRPPITGVHVDVVGGQGGESDNPTGSGTPDGATPVNAIGALGRSAAQAASLGLATPLVAGIDSLTNGRSWADNLRDERALDSQAWRDYPGVSAAGTIGGSLLLPSRIGSAGAAAKDAAVARGLSNSEAMRAALSASARQGGIEGAIYGGVYGAASADGDIKDRLAAGVVSGATGGVAGYGLTRGLGAIASRWGRSDAGAARDAAFADRVDAAKAAQDLSIPVPGFVSGNPLMQRLGTTLEGTPFGAGPIKRGVEGMLDASKSAADRIAGDLGGGFTPERAGDEVAKGAKLYRDNSSAQAGRLYDQAKRLSGDTFVTPTTTMQTIAALIRDQKQVPGGTDALHIIQHYADAFSNGGSITIEGARGMRTALRDRLSQTMMPSDAERLTAQIMGAVNADIEKSLIEAGKPDAAQAYKAADAYYAQRMQNIRDILEPFVGKDGTNWGSEVAAKIKADSQSNGERLDEMLKLMPRDAANEVRSSLIQQLGRAQSGSQDATGDVFSLDTFLTNWDKIRGARERIFPKDTYRALQQLATVAKQAKDAGRLRNASQSGNVMMTASTFAGPAGVIGTGNVLGGSSLFAAFAGGQYGAAKLLASPIFTKRLANAPSTAAAARRFWSGPWVDRLAKSDPSIAADVTGFRDFVLRSIDSGSTSRAAASDSGSDKKQ